LVAEALGDMIVQRLLAGVISVGLIPGVALASAPPFPWRQPAGAVRAQLLGDHGAHVLGRADGIAAGAVAGPNPKPAAAPPEAPTPPPTAAQTAKARSEYDDFAKGRIDRTHYSGYANTQVTDGIVSEVGGLLKSLGTVKSFVPLPTSSYQGMTVYQFVATCTNGSMDELIAWDDVGKISLIFFRKSP
jgi:hypothetical protein